VATLSRPVERKTPKRGSFSWHGEAKTTPTIVVIDSNVANTGQLVGGLPGVPCRINIDDPDVKVTQGPNAASGYRRIILRLQRKGRFFLRITWTALS
jgi:hypothetical protein